MRTASAPFGFVRTRSGFRLRGVVAVAVLALVGLGCGHCPAAAQGEPAAGEIRTGVFPFYEFAQRFDYWAFTPMDQGGRLVQLQVIGSERDEDIVRAIRTPGFFAPWGDPVRWDALEGSELEKSVWLNRWYFIPSFARLYYLTGDRAYLDEILAFVRKWREENPRPADIPAYIKSAKRNWRDMQVAWRVQNLVWTYFLGREGFTAEEKRELFTLIEQHALVLLEDFGKKPLNENNHQSHGATTMLYAALLFPDMAHAAELRAKALEILTHHLDKAFYRDGNSVELCPGYYPFFVSIFRDACLLSRANGAPVPPRSEERLAQFYHYLGKVMQPDGTMPPINDSSESDGTVSLRVLAELLGQPFPYPGGNSHFFDASHQAVMRDRTGAAPAYAFLDAGPQVTSHWHAGKLGFHLWYWGKAFLVDSGISNYDDPLKKSWYLTPPAHNTLLVDGKGDYDADGMRRLRTAKKPATPFAGSRIGQWESNDRYDWAVMTHSGFQARKEPVSWTRHFVMLKGLGSLVIDRIESSGEHDYTWQFHVLPCAPATEDAQMSVFTGFPEKNLLLLPASPHAVQGWKIVEGTMNRQSRNYPHPLVQYEARAKSVTQAFLLLPVAGGERPDIRLAQEIRGEAITVNLQGPFGLATLEIAPTAEAGRGGYVLKYTSP